MNSFYEYFAAQQKMAAYRQAKRLQRGVKLGYGENPNIETSKKIQTSKIHIGLSDYSIEFFGNTVGSIGSSSTCMRTSVGVGEQGGILAWGYEDGSNGINIMRFGNSPDGSANQVYPNAKFDNDNPFHLVITRQGTEIKIYVNNELAITWDTREVLDMGDMDLIFANSSNMGFVRIWNMCLSADDVTSHFNNGDPMGYVVPKAKRDGLLAEYLPQNLMYGQDDKTIATSWLDSAKQLPLSDEYMEPLFQSIGGYDMIANDAPEILYYTYNYDYVGVKLGYGNISTYFYSDEISLGVSDFSIEYWGNAYGSGNGSTPILFNNSAFGSSSNPAYFQVYGTKLGQNNLNWVAFGIPSEGDITTDSLNFNYSAPTIDAKFHLVITREGRKVSVYIDNVLIASKEQSEIKNLGDLQLAIANSSDVGFVRVWNYALSAEKVAQLENSGNPAGYVLPAEMKTGDQRCIAEYLAINLVPKKYNHTVACKWLDSATILPDPDGTLRRIWKSVGGYDMTASGNPIILQ